MPSNLGDIWPDKLTVTEVADILELQTQTVTRMANDGKLTWIGELPDRYITTESLVEYVNKRYGK